MCAPSPGWLQTQVPCVVTRGQCKPSECLRRLRRSCYRSSAGTQLGTLLQATNREQAAREAFRRQLEGASRSPTLALMGDFNHPDSGWEDHTARHSFLSLSS